MSAPARVAAALLLLCSACGANAGTCLPPARAEPTLHEVKSAYYEDTTFKIAWYCEGQPPEVLLDGRHDTDLIWVDGPCDPCDRERIAATALRQVCGADSAKEFGGEAALKEVPVRLLCGPVAWPTSPWDREGCVYAVASDAGCFY